MMFFTADVKVHVTCTGRGISSVKNRIVVLTEDLLC